MYQIGRSSQSSYLLAETTQLPYDGFEVSKGGGIDAGGFLRQLSETEWQDYLEEQESAASYEGQTFIIDCDLLTVLNRKGLAGFLAG